MLEGRGSKRLYAGWMIELYHYTRNANRHMPLSCVQTRDKRLTLLRAKHYAEEWKHYHYFTKSLKALGYSDAEVARSEPLPMTLALSNFMRQAAREDILAYSICSAVLEGTTTDKRSYDSYYETAARLYDIPREAIAPIYAHLDLDVQYQHSDLFLEILEGVDSIPVERQERISSTATSSPSSSGLGPIASSAITRTIRSRCRGIRSIRSSIEKRSSHEYDHS